MNKKESIFSGKKAYIAPISCCLKVSGNNICVVSYTGDHTKAIDGGELEEDTTTPLTL